MSSLFIGNISNSIGQSDLESEFQKYGTCKINYKGAFAFAEFDNEKDAEQAMLKLQKKNMGGRELNIEWSKKSKKYEGSHRRALSP
jgi:RNA recognition motif-containing protein